MIAEDFSEAAWKGLAQSFSSWIFLTEASCTQAVNRGVCKEGSSFVIPWKTKANLTDYLKCPSSSSVDDGFVYFVGKSIDLAKEVVAHWKPEYPKLKVISSQTIEKNQGNVEVSTKQISLQEAIRLSAFYPGQLCIHEQDSFGKAAADAEFAGAFVVHNTLDSYAEQYEGAGISWITTGVVPSGIGMRAAGFADLETELDAAVAAFRSADLKELRVARRSGAVERNRKFLAAMEGWCKATFAEVAGKPALPKHMPPVLHTGDCPPVSIVTLVYGRPQFLDLAFHNLMLTDYPKNKIEWVIVDDSPADQSGSDKIQKFEQSFYPGVIKYLPLAKKASIGAKRNYAVKKASHDILVCMDDDDHYPQTSFRRRVAWLQKLGKGCVTCTSIALYDLQKGISAVNVPPYSLSLAQRCSEASMAFTRAFWQDKNFPVVDVAEGEGFLDGRESAVVEIPPQQILVAFSHGNNATSRRIPDVDTKPGCFWGFPRPYLEFIHGLAGVKVEAA